MINISVFGAVCDGITDDTSAFQAALNASDDVYWSGPCLVGNLTIAHNTRLTGGPGAKLIFKPGATGDCLSTGQNAVTFEDFAMVGGSTTNKLDVIAPALPVPENNRSAIAVAAQLKSRISGIDIEGFGDCGVRTIDTLNNDNFGPHLIFRESWIKNCTTGFRAAHEYIMAHTLDISWCGTALDVRAGNVNLFGMKLSVNYIGAYLCGLDSSNNGHGNLNSSLINHSTYSIFADGIALGFSAVGNQMHQGSIYLRNSRGVQIAHSIIQAAYWIFEGGGRNVVENNMVLFNSAVGLINQVNHNQANSSGPQYDATIVRNNLTLTGAFPDS